MVNINFLLKKVQYFFDDQFIFDINKSNLFPPISLPFSLFNEFATELDIENKKMILFFNQKDFFHTNFLLKGKYYDKKIMHNFSDNYIIMFNRPLQK